MTLPLTKLGRDVAAGYNADGSARRVDNADMQRLFAEYEALLLALAADALDIEFPYGFIGATNGGVGTANAIIATTDRAIPDADAGALIALPIVATNTASPVTVAFNGGAALTIKTRSGEDPAIGELQPGDLLPGYVSGSTFRVIVDPNSLLHMHAAMAWAENDEDDPVEVQYGGDGATTFSSKHHSAKASAARTGAETAEAAAEAARDIAAGYASDTVSQGNVPIYATAAGISAIEVPAGINAIRVNGYLAAGDGLGNLYVDTAGEHGWRQTLTSSGATSRTWYESGDILRAASVTIPTDFATLNDLFDYLKPRRIRAALSVTLSAGTVSESEVLTWDHPDAENVMLTGAYSSVTISSVGSITSNSAYSHDVVLTLADATGVSVGHWIFIPADAVSDDDERCIEGTWRITNIAGDDITIRVTDAGASFPAIADTDIAAEVHKSVVQWDSATTSGLVLTNVAAGKWERIVLDGQFDAAGGAGSDSAGAGLSVATWVHAVLGLSSDHQIGHATGTFRYCSFVRWKYNGVVALGGAHLDINNCNVCSNGWRGVQAGDSSASIFGKSCVISGNRKTGPTFENGGSLNHSNSTISGNGEHGLYGIGGGDGVATGAAILRNLDSGVELRDMGLWLVTSAVMRDNTPYQCRASGAGAVIVVDNINTSGAGTAALRVEHGGTMLARTSDPTIAEGTAYSISSVAPGYVILSSINGPMTGNFLINSVTSPNGGFGLTPTSAGDMVVGRRATGATSALTNVARFGLSELRPESDDAYDLGRAATRWKGVYAYHLTVVDGMTPPGTITGMASIYVDSADGDLKIKFADGTVKTIATDT